ERARPPRSIPHPPLPADSAGVREGPRPLRPVPRRPLPRRGDPLPRRRRRRGGERDGAPLQGVAPRTAPRASDGEPPPLGAPVRRRARAARRTHLLPPRCPREEVGTLPRHLRSGPAGDRSSPRGRREELPPDPARPPVPMP